MDEPKNKHIAITETTKDRFAKFIPKKMFWDDYINYICDFLEDNKESFLQYLEKK